MHMPAGIMPAYVLIVYGLLALTGIVLAFKRANRRLFLDSRQGLYLGISYAVLCGLYSLSAGVNPGMTVHFLGVMLAVMMFGPWVAILLLTAVHVTLAYGLGIGAPSTLGFNIVLCVLLPVGVAALVHTFTYYRLPRIFPVYVLQIGVGDLLCMAAVAGALTLHLLAFTPYSRELVLPNFTLILLAMGGMEATLSTMVAFLLIYFLPEALITYSDEEYLHGK